MWPFRKTEDRASYSDSVVSGLLASAQGSSADPQALAAVEAAAGMVSRAFASGVITPQVLALTPQVLALIGRALIVRGEVVFMLGVDAGGLSMLPASSWDITGGADPRSWRYRLDLPGPSGSVTVQRPAESVVHIRINVDPNRPWRGVSPIVKAGLSAGLAAAAERALTAEAKIPPSRIAPVPTPDEDQRKAYAQRLKDGGIITVQSATISAHVQGQEPAARWQPQVVRPDPSGGMLQLREAGREVISACGVPVELFVSSEGSGSREAWRRFLYSTVLPLARICAHELSLKLDQPGLSFGFDGLFASDIQGRARAFSSMVTAGMAVPEAAALAGLVED